MQVISPLSRITYMRQCNILFVVLSKESGWFRMKSYENRADLVIPLLTLKLGSSFVLAYGFQHISLFLVPCLHCNRPDGGHGTCASCFWHATLIVRKLKETVHIREICIFN